jgi:PHD/YefM family antitoxin component YafN of YafNO toxin-antitoxin module
MHKLGLIWRDGDMKQFSFSDMNRSSGEILETALIEPVALTKYGKEKLVILTAETYQRLTGGLAVQSFGLYDAPDGVHRELMNGLDEILADGDTDA